MNSYFLWRRTGTNDFVSSLTHGIVAKELPVLSLPQERVEFVTMPGRSGSLTIREGEDE